MVKATLQHVEPIRMASSIEGDDVTDQFKLNQEKFSSLGTAEDFVALKDHLIAVPIDKVVSALGDEHYFEVTLPVTGMADFLSVEPAFDRLPQAFPTVIAINGFGANPEGVEGFSKPYFILATDLIGNQYEIIVGQDGKVEIPSEGIGLFSMLSSITLIYSDKQILEGQGFANLKGAGAESGMLYLLPPPGVEAKIEPIVRISELNDRFERDVLYEQKIPIELHTLAQPHETVKVQVEALTGEMSDTLHVGVFQAQAYMTQAPFSLQVELKSLKPNLYKLEDLSHDSFMMSGGWRQIAAETFEKSFGLSEFAKLAVLRNLYSEFDFTKSLLMGENFGIQNTNGFNDFSLRSEAIGPYYDLLIDGVIHSKIPGELLLSHIPDENFTAFDLAYVDLSPHDNSVVSDLKGQFEHYNFTALDSHFLGRAQDLIDDFYIHTNGAVGDIPDAHVSVTPVDGFYGLTLATSLVDHDFSLSSQSLDFIHNQSELASLQPTHELWLSDHPSVTLTPEHQATIIHVGDILQGHSNASVIEGFNIHQDKVDLSSLLQNLPDSSTSQVKVESQGQDIHISLADHNSGDVTPLATLVGANPGLDPLDLSHIIITDL